MLCNCYLVAYLWLQVPGEDHIYLIGTEEGAIHKCSKAYSSEYLATFAGHDMAVYAVKWNPLHQRMFLTAAADWSVKLWDSQHTEQPLLSFDLGASVGDVAWAPYSSTVFAAVTDDGKVHVYDLSMSQTMPMTAQKVSKKARLTKVAFNASYPMLLVGDTKGVVRALKLSPNLRRCCKVDKPGQKLEQLEMAKLDAVIEVARKSQVDAGSSKHGSTAAALEGEGPHQHKAVVPNGKM